MADIEQQCSAGVRGVGEVSDTSRELPHQPAVDRSKRSVGIDGDVPALNQPFELARREVRVEHQTGDGANSFQVARFNELITSVGGASVLPHQSPVQRLSGTAVPNDHRLALIGDANGCDRLVNGFHNLTQRRLHGVPDLECVVLDPTWLGEILRELPIRRGDDLTRLAERNGANPGSACIDRNYDGHGQQNKCENAAVPYASSISRCSVTAPP